MDPVLVTYDELASVRACVMGEILAGNEDGDTIASIVAVKLDSEWVKAQEWYQRITEDLDVQPNTPDVLARYLETSNSGWNVLLKLTDTGYTLWMPDLYEIGNLGASGPAYQGAYSIRDTVEGTKWVLRLPEDYVTGIWL